MRDYIQETVDILWPQVDFPTNRLDDWPASCAEAYRELRFEEGRVAARKELARLIAIELQEASIIKPNIVTMLPN
jgi:hypothetical protein